MINLRQSLGNRQVEAANKNTIVNYMADLFGQMYAQEGAQALDPNSGGMDLMLVG